MERFLYRLSLSEHSKHFVLKGATMFKVWAIGELRPTLDIDLLGHPEVIEKVDSIIHEICQQTMKEDDGLIFDSTTIRTEPIAKNMDFDGVRSTFQARLANSRIPLQIDVGFGKVFPSPVNIEITTILDFPSTFLSGYTKESSIAEKFHAIVKLEMLNSRLKDFFDIWLLSQKFEFQSTILAGAIEQTFTHRSTIIPQNPISFSSEFYNDHSKNVQWSAFLRKKDMVDQAPNSLKETVEVISSFITPIIDDLLKQNGQKRIWKPSGPWITK